MSLAEGMAVCLKVKHLLVIVSRRVDLPQYQKKLADHCKFVSSGLPVIMSPYMWQKNSR